MKKNQYMYQIYTKNLDRQTETVLPEKLMQHPKTTCDMHPVPSKYQFKIAEKTADQSSPWTQGAEYRRSTKNNQKRDPKLWHANLANLSDMLVHM